MDKPRIQKPSKWCSEQCVKKMMALNRKEDIMLQQTLDQLHREENHLLREYEYDIWKTEKAFDARVKKLSNGSGGSNLMLRRNSLPAIEPDKPRAGMTNARWHSLTQCSPREKPKDEHDKKPASEDVLFEIDNDFKFLSVAFGTEKDQSPTSSSATKFPRIRNSTPGSTGSYSKAALMRRRHSDVTTLRDHMQRYRSEKRRSSLADIHTFGSRS